VTKTLYEFKIDSGKVQELHELIINDLQTMNLNVAEAIIALMAILGTQYNGGMMNTSQMKDFIDQLSKWLAAYFGADASRPQ
jgi:hypothetical protein